MCKQWGQVTNKEQKKSIDLLTSILTEIYTFADSLISV